MRPWRGRGRWPVLLAFHGGEGRPGSCCLPAPSHLCWSCVVAASSPVVRARARVGHGGGRAQGREHKSTNMGSLLLACRVRFRCCPLVPVPVPCVREAARHSRRGCSLPGGRRGPLLSEGGGRACIARCRAMSIHGRAAWDYIPNPPRRSPFFGGAEGGGGGGWRLLCAPSHAGGGSPVGAPSGVAVKTRWRPLGSWAPSRKNLGFAGGDSVRAKGRWGFSGLLAPQTSDVVACSFSAHLRCPVGAASSLSRCNAPSLGPSMRWAALVPVPTAAAVVLKGTGSRMFTQSRAGPLPMPFHSTD